jgi:EXS family
MLKSRTFLLLKRIFVFSSLLSIWIYNLQEISFLFSLLTTLSFAIWLWTLNLDILYTFHIDTLTILNHRKGHTLSGLYGISIINSTILIISILLTFPDSITLTIIILFWILPHSVYHAERYTILDVLGSSFLSKITISEVVFCDLMTSYSKIMTMVIIETGMMVRDGYGSDMELGFGIVPGLMAIPFLIRFRQCVLEYFMSKEYKNVVLWFYYR